MGWWLMSEEEVEEGVTEAFYTARGAIASIS
jgi:hypothetical protein